MTLTRHTTADVQADLAERLEIVVGDSQPAGSILDSLADLLVCLAEQPADEHLGGSE